MAYIYLQYVGIERERKRVECSASKYLLALQQIIRDYKFEAMQKSATSRYDALTRAFVESKFK